MRAVPVRIVGAPFAREVLAIDDARSVPGLSCHGDVVRINAGVEDRDADACAVVSCRTAHHAAGVWAGRERDVAELFQVAVERDVINVAAAGEDADRDGRQAHGAETEVPIRLGY